MTPTTIGVIGCGYWGPNLLRNFAENERAQLRWICDLDESRLAAMGRRYPAAQTTNDYERLLADPELELTFRLPKQRSWPENMCWWKSL